MRIIMISPTPFCPSLEPCDRLTPAEVNTRTVRTQVGGLPSFGGCTTGGHEHRFGIDGAQRQPEQIQSKVK